MSVEMIDARLTVLVTKARKRELEAEAKAKKTTVGALVRQRIDGEPNEEAAAAREQAARRAALAGLTDEDARVVASLIAPAIARDVQHERAKEAV